MAVLLRITYSKIRICSASAPYKWNVSGSSDQRSVGSSSTISSTPISIYIVSQVFPAELYVEIVLLQEVLL
jgi:hypothetical protein